MNLPLIYKLRIQLLTVLIAICLLTACKEREQRINEITKIEVATGSCFGTCPLTVVSIDSSLTYKYYGGQYAKKKGYYQGKIDQRLWDTLNIKMEHIHYKTLRYGNRTSDDQDLEIIIHYGAKRKRIAAEAADLPDSARKVFYWIANTYPRVKLKPVKDMIKFETQVQYPFVSPVKFPPNFRFSAPSHTR